MPGSAWSNRIADLSDLFAVRHKETREWVLGAATQFASEEAAKKKLRSELRNSDVFATREDILRACEDYEVVRLKLVEAHS